MIDHFNLPVSDLDSSRAFYEEILQEIGYSILMSDADAIGFGHDTWAFGIVQENNAIIQIHLAFTAASHHAVQAFYQRAIDLGAQSNGSPGLRPQYGPTYYSAYVFDPDGHNVEVVCRDK